MKRIWEMMLPLGFKMKSEQFSRHAVLACFAVFIFYCVVFSANLLGIPFYLGYRRFIVNIVLFSPIVDRLLWVSSLVVSSTVLFIRDVRSGAGCLRRILVLLYGLVLVALAYALLFGFEVFGVVALVVSGLAFAALSISHGKVFGGWRVSVFLLLFYGMLVLLGIEVASLARWVYHLFSPSLVFADGSWSIAFAEAQISNILYPVLPSILMFFAFSWVGEFAFKGLLTKSGDIKAETAITYRGFSSKSFKVPLIITLISVATAIFVGYCNFAIARIADLAFAGTDTPYYIKCLNDMLSTGSVEALSYASENDRFLYLIIQYSFFWFSGLSPEVFVTFVMPVVLTFLLMVSTFMLVRVGRSRLHAATAMLVTVFSFQVTVGLYGGFYANWFAVAFVYLFYGILMTVLRGRRNAFLLVLTGLTSVAVLHVHPWTWIFLIMIIPIAYMSVSLLLVRTRRIGFRNYAWEIKFLVALLAVNAVMFYLRDFLGIGSGTSIVDGYVDVKRLNPSILNVFRLKYFLDRTFNWYVGGFYAYTPIMILSILGVLSFLDYEDRYNRLLLTWMLIASSMVFVDFPWHARFLYITPFNIYVALGILYGAEQLFKIAESRGLKHLAPMVFWVFYLLSILLLLNYTLRCTVIKQFGPAGLTLTP